MEKLLSFLVHRIRIYENSRDLKVNLPYKLHQITHREQEAMESKNQITCFF